MIKYLFFIILILCVLKYYQSNMNNIGIISLIIVLGLYIIDLIMKNNIETFASVNYRVNLYDNNDALIKFYTITHNELYYPFSSNIISDNLRNRISNYPKIKITPPSGYNILAVYNFGTYNNYFYCGPYTSGLLIPPKIDDQCELNGFIIYKNYLIDYSSHILNQLYQKIENVSETPQINNTVVNCTFTFPTGETNTSGGDTKEKYDAGNNIWITYGYIRIRQNSTRIGNIISFDTGLYRINNTYRKTSDYYRLSNLVDEWGRNIATYIKNMLVNPTDTDIIYIDIPGYYVYAYYGSSNNICFKTSNNTNSTVAMHYKINDQILNNIIISHINYCMTFGDTAMITNVEYNSELVTDKYNNFITLGYS